VVGGSILRMPDKVANVRGSIIIRTQSSDPLSLWTRTLVNRRLSPFFSSKERPEVDKQYKNNGGYIKLESRYWCQLNPVP